MKDDFEKDLDSLLEKIEEEIEVDDEFIPRSVASSQSMPNSRDAVDSINHSYPVCLRGTDDVIQVILSSQNPICENQDTECTPRNLCERCIPILGPIFRYIIGYCIFYSITLQELILPNCASSTTEDTPLTETMEQSSSYVDVEGVQQSYRSFPPLQRGDLIRDTNNAIVLNNEDSDQ